MPYSVAAVRGKNFYSGSAVTYLLRDEFTTDDAAPITDPRTCEPGPGTLDITDTGNDFDIVSSKLQNVAFTGYGDPRFYTSNTYARATGQTIYYKLNAKDVNTGWDTSNTDISPDRNGMRPISTNIAVQPGPSYAGNKTAATEYEYAIVQQTAGAIFLVKGGTEYLEWTLLWADRDVTDSPLYAGYTSSNNQPNYLDSFRVFQLGTPWDVDYGIATDRLAGARSSGDTYTHEADCVVICKIDTVPSGGQIELEFRQQTANTDCWRVTVNSAGDLELDEVVSSSATQRGVSAGVIANNDYIGFSADDEDIWVHEGTVGQSRRITYSSASNFKTETDGELETEGTGGAVSEIIAWPRTLSGAALTELEKY